MFKLRILNNEMWMPRNCKHVLVCICIIFVWEPLASQKPLCYLDLCWIWKFLCCLNDFAFPMQLAFHLYSMLRLSNLPLVDSTYKVLVRVCLPIYQKQKQKETLSSYHSLIYYSCIFAPCVLYFCFNSSPRLNVFPQHQHCWLPRHDRH